MENSLSTRLLLPIIMTALGGILLLVVSGALWIIHQNGNMLEEYRLREGHVMAEGLANAVAPELVRKDYGGVESRLMQAASSQSVRSALAIDTQGQVLSYVVRHADDMRVHPDFSMQHAAPPPHAVHLVEESHPGFLQVWHIVNAGTDVGWVRIEIGSGVFVQSMSKMNREVWVLALVVGLLGIVMLGAAILRSHRLLRLHESEEEHARHLLEDKAHYDSLTGLPNRLLLRDRLGQAIARNTRTRHLLAVCFADLDNFKPINDKYGHDMGDRVLVETARRLHAAVRGGDTVARLGGDEFVVLLGELDNEREAGQAVERLLLALKAPLKLEGNEMQIRASIGYVLHPDDSADAEVLIDLADQAMYLAKSSGGCRTQRYRFSEKTA